MITRAHAMHFIYFFILIVCLVPARALSSDNESIKIIVNNWSSQQVLSHIIGNIYQQIGLKVNYVNYPTEGQWFILQQNKAHVQVEVWQGTMEDKLMQLLKMRAVLDAGSYDVKTREEWWYPEYVEEQCPELPNWEALNTCYKLFSKSKKEDFGIYYAGPWEKPDSARIRALGLKFKIEVQESSQKLWVKLSQAYKNKEPIVIFNWTPNWIGSIYKGKFIEFPEFAYDCEVDPTWGVNKRFLHDCGNPKSGWLKKLASTDLKKKWPCAFKILSNANLNTEQFEQIAAFRNVNGFSITHAARYWMTKNKDLWSAWIPKECHKL